MQRVFSSQLAVSGDPVYSATKAGYSAPGTLGPRMAANPDVAKDVQRQLEQGINNLVPLALWRLERVMADDSQKGAVHVAGAKLILDQAKGRLGASDRDLAEMSAEQIRELLVETERAYAARMKTVESAQAAPNLFD